MKIASPYAETRDGLLWLEAGVDWEESGRGSQRLLYAVPEAFAGDVSPRTEALVLVGALAAMRMRETRVAIDGEVCPQFYEGLQAAMEVFRSWNRRWRPVRLDVEQGCAHAALDEAREPAALVSGGIDSLALLRANALAYAPEHPSRIRTGFIYRGIWAPDRPGDNRTRERLEAAVEALAPAADDVGVTLVPVYSNFRALTDWDTTFWQYEYQGAALASAAHLFADRINKMSLASTWDVAHLGPWGSHPLVDGGYGTHDLAIRHEQALLSRLDKTKIVADWPAALEILRVCNRLPEAAVNCGQCEKCVRTMFTLAALGSLPQAKTFPSDEVTPDTLAGVRVPYRAVEPDYLEIAAELSRTGQDDLSAALLRCVTRSRLSRRWRKVKQLRRRLVPAADRTRRRGRMLPDTTSTAPVGTGEEPHAA